MMQPPWNVVQLFAERQANSPLHHGRWLPARPILRRSYPPRPAAPADALSRKACKIQRPAYEQSPPARRMPSWAPTVGAHRGNRRPAMARPIATPASAQGHVCGCGWSG